MKQWFATTVLALAAATAHAGPFTGWDVGNGASTFANTPADGDFISLTTGAGQVGTAWAPGAMDWSGKTSGTVTLDFTFRAMSAGGGGLALILATGPVDATPTGTFGLLEEDDGAAFFVRPTAGKAGSASFGAYGTSLFKGGSGYSGDMEASRVYGRLEATFAGTSATFWLSLASTPSAYEEVAYLYMSDFNAMFDDTGAIRVGFGGTSTVQTGSSIDLLSFAGPSELMMPVPEPESIVLAIAGLLAIGALRRPASRQA